MMNWGVEYAAPWSWGHGGWWWAMGLHGLFWVLLIAVLVTALVLIVRGASGRGEREAAAGGRESARALLDARYARGEIEREDYLRRKQDLA
ncbi:MAG: hypothetical protein HY521_03245 [Proteobacteria bacterium]|nr:hypothetical protein [Pseudomonadota bacterium]